VPCTARTAKPRARALKSDFAREEVWTYAYSASTFTFSDGSTGTNAYQNGVACVWGFEASGGPCVEIDVTFLRSEAPTY
jgi:hypothetical protein